MSRDWQKLQHPYERLRWARERAGHKSAAAGARKAKVGEVTYRSHEAVPESMGGNGRVIDAGWAQLYGKAFDVYWPWLLTGEASPFVKYATESPEDRRWGELTKEERETALRLLDAAIPRKRA